MTDYASAYPRKRFFLEMFTRDISLEDCILDLIDNSVDAYVRSHHLTLDDLVFKHTRRHRPRQGRIALSLSPERFVVSDDCGGITWHDAQNDVFNFGHSEAFGPRPHRQKLGAYGIGLKRALFKIGNHFRLESRTPEGAFCAELNVHDWAKKDDSAEDWRIPLRALRPRPGDTSGTTITITQIRSDVRAVLSDPTFTTRLHQAAASAYGHFIDHFVDLVIGGIHVDPAELAVGKSQAIAPAHKRIKVDGVVVDLTAGVAPPRSATEDWRTRDAGWYVLCNGRTVVVADKSELTGWGEGALPIYVQKYRGFIGVASFASDDPLKLPWTTTKRNLNRESPVFLQARKEMALLTRPVLSYLDTFYRGDPVEDVSARMAVKQLRAVDVRAKHRVASGKFPKAGAAAARDTQRVQYDASVADLQRVRRHLRQPKMPANRIGEHTLDYFLRAEGLK